VCQAPEEKAEQYHVSVDWVLDGAQYNEWMNEEDYELEENGKVKVSTVVSNLLKLKNAPFSVHDPF
jgi:hypothetical protein